MKTIYSVLMIFFFVMSLKAQVTFQWSYIYDVSSLRDALESTSVDNQGNVFLAGNRIIAGSKYEPFIARVSTTGSLQYSRSFSHPYGDNPIGKGCYFRSAAADNQGNVVVAGVIDSGIGVTKGVVLKYNSAGDTVWGRYSGINDTLGNCWWGDVKLDNSGNIYVAGHSIKYSPTRIVYITAKYNQNGVLLWLKGYSPSAFYDLGYGYRNLLELDNGGNVYYATSYQKTSSSGSHDIFVTKLNSSGSLLWTKSFNGAGDKDDFVNDLAVDAAGNVYAAGLSNNLNSNAEMLCVKFNSANGSTEWANYINGTGTFGNDEFFGISVYGNDVYPAGTIYNTGSGHDAILVKFNSSGAEQWRKVESAGGDEMVKDVKTDPSGVYTVSNFTSGTYSVKTSKYNFSGDTLWNTSYHVNTHNELAKFINVGPSNNVYISGDENFINSGYVYLVRYTNNITGVHNDPVMSPNKFMLSQNYPNPFNPSTKINFNIPVSGFVELTIFDVTGRTVETPVRSVMMAGSHSIEFNAASLPSGVYFYRLETESFADTKKMILTK